MAAAKTKEMPELMKEHAQKMAGSEKNRMTLAKLYSEEDKAPIMISPLYQPYFGRVMDVTINGIAVYVPVDGTTHLLPQTFADEVYSRVMAIDKVIKKQQRMADIPENVESSPGELKLF